MVDYVEAIKRPILDTTSLLYGVVLGILGVLVIPALIIDGFVLGVAKNAASGSPGLPQWGEWVDLLVKGILFWIISFLYMLIPIVLFSLGAGSMLMSLLMGDTAAVAAGMGTGGIMITIGSLLMLIAALLLPIALVKYAVEGSFGAAFKIGDIIKKVLSLNYIISWIVVSVYAVVVYMVLGTVTFFFPLIGTGIASYIVAVTAMDVFGQVYQETA